MRTDIVSYTKDRLKHFGSAPKSYVINRSWLEVISKHHKKTPIGIVINRNKDDQIKGTLIFKQNNTNYCKIMKTGQDNWSTGFAIPKIMSDFIDTLPYDADTASYRYPKRVCKAELNDDYRTITWTRFDYHEENNIVWEKPENEHAQFEKDVDELIGLHENLIADGLMLDGTKIEKLNVEIDKFNRRYGDLVEKI